MHVNEAELAVSATYIGKPRPNRFTRLRLSRIGSPFSGGIPFPFRVPVRIALSSPAAAAFSHKLGVGERFDFWHPRQSVQRNANFRFFTVNLRESL